VAGDQVLSAQTIRTKYRQHSTKLLLSQERHQDRKKYI